MKEPIYTATISKNKGKEGLSMIFRHPLRVGPDGKPGKRIRRGLNTTSTEEAEKIVKQMNELLSDKSYWAPTMQEKAKTIFNPIVISAFYDYLMPEIHDSWNLRDNFLPLPGKNEGYSKCLLIGVAGAGKTTLLRQMIGTDPIKERFPSASASKTTTCDIEIILSENNLYKAIITFLPKEKTRQLTEECVVASILSYMEKEDELLMERKFLEHIEQRFRLSYLLGTLNSLKNIEDEITDDDVNIEITNSDETQLTETEREALSNTLIDFLETIKIITKDIYESAKKDLNFDIARASKSEIDSFFEIIEDEIIYNDNFHQLVDSILDEIENKFSFLEQGNLSRNRNWPDFWTFETTDRTEFIKTINKFSSNHATNFGKLLTPMVDGIRVMGPFKNELIGMSPNIVILDGEGMGHTPSSFSSISTQVSKKFSIADSIILVDNAAQAIQATSVALVRAIITSGQEEKLSIAFTHFDAVIGPNLPNNVMKKNHLFAALDVAIDSIGKDLGKRAENTLKQIAVKESYFLSNIQNELTSGKKFTINELTDLIKSIKAKIEPKSISDIHAIYDSTNLILSFRSALEDFHYPWRARIGLSRWMDITPEHWTRIKALTRRLGLLREDEYKDLKPVADLIKSLREHLYKFISIPLRFEPPSDNEKMQQEAISKIANEINYSLHQFIPNILFESRIPDWNKAFSENRGSGSTFKRAADIKKIYDFSAPIPDELPSVDSNIFITELKKLVKDAIEKMNGQLF